MLHLACVCLGAGETLSCGSGACAVAVASVTRTKVNQRKVSVSLPGGDLSLEWTADGDVVVEGPATTVFEGTIMVQVPLKLNTSV
jgi:diaminopimelate epimerase